MRNVSGLTGWLYVQAMFITDRDAWAYVLTQFCFDTQKLLNLLDGFLVLQAGFLHSVGGCHWLIQDRPVVSDTRGSTPSISVSISECKNSLLAHKH